MNELRKLKIFDVELDDFIHFQIVNFDREISRVDHKSSIVYLEKLDSGWLRLSVLPKLACK